ncbi:peptidase MA family metallohydrolase [Sporanaerobacter acetigenes]|uniref:Peptidase MA-like domain-containing protein n=1 Tax=Sporanaerobacter acetigenes DSM 13106 TaxID=1123281 RepID=A0A1M5YX36_9FIRM|nr:hypothetical protein [Sporanaerobacter acetigenes]SHI16424.1 hypothetical protein SAMN02745180_02521 [Sporanaerobacter acetigenes DSM 13106]
MKKLFVYTSILSIIILFVISIEGFLKISTYSIVKDIEKRRILKDTSKYSSLNTVHFLIKYNDGDENIATITGDVLEEHYDEVCNKLECFPKDKNIVIIYNSEDDFRKALKFKNKDLPLGAYYCGTINILSPYMWGDGIENTEEIYRKTGPHIHEFTHLLVDEKTKGNYPMWLTEGISLYMENTIIGFSWDAGKDETSNIGIEELNDNFQGIREEVAYRKSFEIVRDIIDEYGFTGFNLLLDSLGNGKNIKKSVEMSLKVKFKDID